MASIAHWLEAARLRTLPLSFASILAGSSIVIGDTEFNTIIFALTVSTTLFLQILSNFSNDYGDALHGADHEGRQGPERMVFSGKISQASMKLALIISSVLALLSGLLLIYFSFPSHQIFKALIMLLLGLFAIWAAINYTVGKSPYGYAGLGDISVLLFFGIIGVMGTAFLQLKEIRLADILPALSFGLLSVAVLNVNNMRDIQSDSEAGKYSIPVRIGFKASKIYHSFLVLIPQILMISYANYNNYKGYEWSFMVIFPILWLHLVKVWKTEENQKLDPQLKIIALSSFLMSGLMFISRL